MRSSHQQLNTSKTEVIGNDSLVDLSHAAITFPAGVSKFQWVRQRAILNPAGGML